MSLTKKELFNAKNSSISIHEGLEINVVNTGSYEDVDKDGHPVNVAVLVSDAGDVYGSISKTVYESLDLLEDIISEDGSALVTVKKSISNNNREFYQLMVK